MNHRTRSTAHAALTFTAAALAAGVYLATATADAGPATHNHRHGALGGGAEPAHPAGSAPALAQNPADPATGFLVIAPDRGFTGNEEARAAFAALAARHNAELVFATDERTRGSLDEAPARLATRGARQVVALPLFVSSARPQWALARGLLLPERGGPPIAIARPFGESYLAVELLAERLRAITEPATARVVVAGFGAADGPSAHRMEADLQRLADQAAVGLGLAAVRARVWPQRNGLQEDPERARLEQALREEAGEGRLVVVPFHLGRKLDAMMAFNTYLARCLPAGAELLPGDVTPHPLVATWLLREANRHTPLAPHEVGVVVHAHGSDFHWNETMRQAVAPLAARYPVEFAFSMADPATLEGAIRRLEARGARAAVVVRVFGREASFKASIERLLGLDVEGDAGAIAAAGHGSHGGPAPRIRTPLLLATAGGLDDDPLFARALLDRARTLSREPARETVILTTHGTGDDIANLVWLKKLESLAAQMRSAGGAGFRAIRVATWREDWADKRGPWIALVRRWVEEAGGDGGRALVIPARTTGEGPEHEFLAGLEYVLGSGFAPHPLFGEWVEKQVLRGMETLARGGAALTREPAAAPPMPRDGAPAGEAVWLPQGVAGRRMAAGVFD